MMVANLLLLALLGVVPWVELQDQTPPTVVPQTPRRSTTEDDPTPPPNAAKLLKYQHDETMKDINRLVKLVNEVHDEMDKAGENVLPLGTLKKLDEVERLTRRIRGKIKQ